MNYGKWCRFEKSEDEFSLCYIELKGPVEHPSDNIYQAFGYMNWLMVKYYI